MNHALEVKRRLRAGETVFSAWITFSSTGIAEVVAGTGFDIVLIDTEHTSIGLDDLEAMIAAMSRWRPVVIVRVPGPDPLLVKRILDVGADGIIFPATMNAEETRRAVHMCKYAPAGDRGYGPRRATNYYRDTDAYVSAANDAIFVIPQIERMAAVEHADAIAAVPGVDVICLGPMDLSLSAGLLGQLEHPTIKGAIDRICDAARKRNLPVCLGMAVPPPEQPFWVEKGARLVIASDDLQVLSRGMTLNLKQCQELFPKKR